MAGMRGRTGKVISSGRISVPLRPLSCKKRAAVRKISSTSADSGYSLCSTDSEDQVLVLHEGLDRCAALLQDILQSDGRENAMKSHRATFPRPHLKSSVKVKKNVARKQSAASHVLKEKGLVKKSQPSATCNVPRPCVSTPSPVNGTPSSDYVQTRMQIVNMPSCPAGSVPLLSTQGPESAVLFNCRLPSSTPTLSPQHPACHQDASYGTYQQSLPLGGATPFPSSAATPSTTPPVPSAMCSVAAPLQPTSMAPTSSQATLQADIMSQLNFKKPLDVELLQQFAAYLAQLPPSESSGQSQVPVYPTERERERPIAETDETSSEEDETFARDNALARDISCQTGFSNHKKASSPEKAERKIKTVKYLLGEIKALVAEQDGEALRLITELEHSVSLLPAMVGSTNVHAEIALALQPLRSENAQLRRRLRILNQQLRDRERTARSDEHHYELTSLQSMNDTLQQQLIAAQKHLQSLQSKNEELLKVIEAQKDENRKFSQTVQEKEQLILQIQQQNVATSARVDIEAEDVTGKMKSFQFKLESAEKENQILGITLRQREAEVSRLRELTRTLQSSMAKLLCDLRKDNTKSRAGGQLTQAALDSYEKQLGSDQCAASSSILSYLKKLAMEQAVQSDPPNSASAPYNNGLTSDPSDGFTVSKSNFNYPTAKSTTTSIPPFSPQKLRAEGSSDSCYAIDEQYKPDETTYLPLASSPHKDTFTPSLLNMCTPPKRCSDERELVNKVSYPKLSTSERSPTAQRNLFSTPNTDQPTKTDESDISAPCDPSPNYPHLLQHLRNLQITNSGHDDRSTRDVLSERCDWSVASFSTFTSHDEQDFRSGLAALDANIAKLQRTLQSSSSRK